MARSSSQRSAGNVPTGGKFGASYLGELGTRLQRLLGFDGDAGVSFTPQAVPVMIVGDATLPGYADQSGRRWAAVSTIMGGVDLNFWLRSTQDQIIERVTFFPTNAALGRLECSQSANTLADPAGGAGVPQGSFCDRMLTRDDRPPIRGLVAAFVLDVNRFVMSIDDAGVAVHTPCPLLVEPFCLRAENLFYCRSLLKGGYFVVNGRTL